LTYLILRKLHILRPTLSFKLQSSTCDVAGLTWTNLTIYHCVVSATILVIPVRLSYRDSYDINNIHHKYHWGERWKNKNGQCWRPLRLCATQDEDVDLLMRIPGWFMVGQLRITPERSLLMEAHIFFLADLVSITRRDSCLIGNGGRWTHVCAISMWISNYLIFTGLKEVFIYQADGGNVDT
jgi:hypothetical protein